MKLKRFKKKIKRSSHSKSRHSLSVIRLIKPQNEFKHLKSQSEHLAISKWNLYMYPGFLRKYKHVSSSFADYMYSQFPHKLTIRVLSVFYSDKRGVKIRVFRPRHIENSSVHRKSRVSAQAQVLL